MYSKTARCLWPLALATLALCSCAIAAAPRPQLSACPRLELVGVQGELLELWIRADMGEPFSLMHDEGNGWQHLAQSQVSKAEGERLLIEWNGEAQSFRALGRRCASSTLELAWDVESPTPGAVSLQPLARSVRVDAPANASPVVVLLRRDLRDKGASPVVVDAQWSSDLPFVDVGLDSPAVYAYSIANTRALMVNGRAQSYVQGPSGPEAYAVLAPLNALSAPSSSR